MWTFIGVEGVEPTNNGPERMLRHGVLWRKRSLLEFLTACCRARLEGSRAGSLLPGKAMSAMAA